MTLALDLTAELWPLLDLVVAIFQPVVVLLLCGGVVVASMHLFAMLGTQWGNRRVTGKALIFSLVIHASLICAVIALIPEYQPTSTATSFEADDSVEISSGITSESSSFDEERAGSDPTLQPWERIPTTLVVPVDRAEINVPDASPAAIASLEARPAREAVVLPDPIFVPLPPSHEESSELAKAVVPLEYNPASFQPTMDPVTRPEPSQAPSRSAPAIQRAVPVLTSVPANSQLSQLDRPLAKSISTDFSPDLETELSSALPSPEATALQEMPLEQRPQQRGAAPFQVSETSEESPFPPESRPSQSAAPALKANRSTPRSVPQSMDGIAKVERSQPRTTPGIPAVDPSDLVMPIEHRDVGQEALPKLMGLQGLSSVPLVNSIPAQYQLRSKEQRGQALEQFGGSKQSEAAVDLALQWLASIQDVEGFWDGDAYGAGKVDVQGGINRQFAGKNADTGLTALAILAFLGKQNTLEEGDYSENVTKALRWLVYQQGKSSQGMDGYLGGNAADIAGTYSHAIATFAIAEAYAMTKDPANAEFLLEPLQKAVRYTLLCQLEDGGWRYKRGQVDGGDMSIFGWQLMALKSAQAAGLEIPLSTRQKMILFLQERGLGKSGGLAAYRPKERPSVAMTAESLFCKQMLGLSRDHPSCDEAVGFLMNNPPGRQSMNLYTWYYSTLALYQYGGEPWERWNGRLRDLLIAEQVTSGEYAGSWEPRDQWGGYGGRIYSTAFATLTLEVYYRYLPLYRSTAPAALPQLAEPLTEPPANESP